MTTAAVSATPTRHHPTGSRLLAAHLATARASIPTPPKPANTNAVPLPRGSHTLAAALLAGANKPKPPPDPAPAPGQAASPTAKDQASLQYVPPRPPMSKEEREAHEAEIAAAKDLRIAAARESAAAFCEYVLKDEGTLGEITLARAQQELHDFCDAYPQCVLWAHIEYGKSTLVSVGRVLWELGRNPNLRIAIVSETDSKAKKLLRGIRRYLLNSRELREVFPHLRRSKNKDDPWNAHAITVQRETFARDPSIQVTGCGGSIIGARIDLLILDDILSHRTALTKSAQEKLLAWFASNCAGRLTEHGRIIAVGTPWAKNDLMHTLAKTPGWVSKKFPVIDPTTGLPTWPENWSLDRIAKARQRLGPIEAARQLDCEPSDESTDRFPAQAITRSLENGNGLDFITSWADLFPEDVPPHLQYLPEGAFTVTGVDVGASMRSTGGFTVLTTLLVYPNGERQILCIESGRWTGPQVLQRCFETHARYKSTIFVEDNGAQKFLIDFASAMGLAEIPPIRPHTTGRNKHDPTFGVESIATEMWQGRWSFPNENNGAIMHEEMAALLKEMRDYTPDDHTGDKLMSLWIANMGAHTLRSVPGANQVRARAFAPVDGSAREYDL